MRPRARPSGGLDRHHVVAGDGVLSRLAIVGPGLHELPALLDDGAALVGPLQGIALDVGQAQLDDLPSQGARMTYRLFRDSLVPIRAEPISPIDPPTRTSGSQTGSAQSRRASWTIGAGPSRAAAVVSIQAPVMIQKPKS